MKTLKSLFFLGALVITSTQSYAQSSQDIMEEFMKMRKEMFDSIMSDSFNGDDFEGRVMEMMKQMDQQMNQGNAMDSWPDIHNQISNLGGGANWTESDTHRSLTIKVKQIKDKPLDIKIQNGMITLKGQTETGDSAGKTKTIGNFQKSYSIPSDVDQTSPEFENSADKIIIKFKKLNQSKTVKTKVIESTPQKAVKDIKKEAPVKNQEERFPIGPGDSEMGL